MEDDEDPITTMARTMYTQWSQDSVLCSSEFWPDWSGLTQDIRNRWLVLAARAHTAYHDRYEYLATRSWGRFD